MQKISCQLDVFEVCILYPLQCAVFKLNNIRFGEGKDNRRMRGDDELGIFRDHLLQHGDEGQLARGRKRGFGFIQKIQAIRHKTRLKRQLSMRRRMAMGSGVCSIDCGLGCFQGSVIGANRFRLFISRTDLWNLFPMANCQSCCRRLTTWPGRT